MGRMVTCNIWEDEFIVSLSFFDRLVWIGLITIADDQGRIQDSANLIRSKMFPMDDVPLKEIDAALNSFYKASKIARYIVDGKKIIQIVHWWKHQRPQWAGKSAYPADNGWVDRIRCHIKDNKILSQNWDSEGGYIADYIAPYIDGKVKREGEGDVKGEGEDKESSSDSFTSVQTWMEEVTGLPAAGQPSIEAIKQIAAMNATKDDITKAYEWYRQNTGKPLKYYGSLVNSIRTEQAKRVANKTKFSQVEGWGL